MERLKHFIGLGADLELGKMPDDLISTLADMVLGSPAVCIYRANGGNVARPRDSRDDLPERRTSRLGRSRRVLLGGDRGLPALLRISARRLRKRRQRLSLPLPAARRHGK